MSTPPEQSTAARALEAAGDHESARDVAALDLAARGVDRKLKPSRAGLVERLMFGPAPSVAELASGAALARSVAGSEQSVVAAALGALARGEAFTADARLSTALRRTVARLIQTGLIVDVAGVDTKNLSGKLITVRAL